jgi:glucan biosynthesis protein C
MRLLLPLAACAVTLNALEHAWLANRAADLCVAGATCAVNLPTTPWLGHLWFLLDLFVYTALLVVVAPWLPPVGATVERGLARLPGAARLPLALALAVLACFGWSLAIGVATLTFDVLDQHLLGFWSFTWVADHLFFFATGAVLAALPSFRAWLTGPLPIALTALSGLAGTIAVIARETLPLHRDSLTGKIAFEFAETIPAVLLTVFAVTACIRLHRWIRPYTAKLASWSYSVYLVHHLVVVAVALALLDVALPPVVKFAVALVTTAVFSTLAAAGIERSRWLTLMFNGELRQPVATAVGHAGSSGVAVADAGPQSVTARASAAPSDLDILETPLAARAHARATAETDAADRKAS